MSSNNISPWYMPPLLFGLRITHSFRAIIAHEDKPGVFKFVWYSSRQFRHVSFLVVNNGFFVDDNVRKAVSDLFFSVRFATHCLQLFPKLSGLIRHIQALVVSPFVCFYFFALLFVAVLELIPHQSKR
jgi:hypothetical protein